MKSINIKENNYKLKLVVDSFRKDIFIYFYYQMGNCQTEGGKQEMPVFDNYDTKWSEVNRNE